MLLRFSTNKSTVIRYRTFIKWFDFVYTNNIIVLTMHINLFQMAKIFLPQSDFII